MLTIIISILQFFQDKLFPYVRKNLKTFVENNFDKDELQADISALRKQVSRKKHCFAFTWLNRHRTDKSTNSLSYLKNQILFTRYVTHFL